MLAVGLATRVFCGKEHSLMSISIDELQASLQAVQEELLLVRERLRQLEQAVSVQTDDQGLPRVRLQCTELVVRPASEPGGVSLRLGSSQEGGFLHLHRPGDPQVAGELGMDEEGGPQLLFRGRDQEPRLGFFTREDCGFLVAHGPEGRPGVLVRAQPRGGSVAVLQQDGRSRGVLIHEDGQVHGDGTVTPPGTELVLSDDNLHTLAKIGADAEGGMLTLGPPGQPDALAMVARGEGPALMLHSPSELQSISMMALEGSAQISVHEGKTPGTGFEACLSSGDEGSSFSLRGENSEKAVDISSLNVASSITLHDAEGDVRVMLAHHHGSHSALTLQSVGEEDGFRVIASAEVSSMELISPENPETKLLSAVTAEKPVVVLQKQQRPLLMFGEGEQGGVFCAYGSASAQAGIAALSGGPLAGSVLLSSADGTPLLSLDATDHGGRLLINNDLGFQRVALGVHQESGGLHLNNTGSVGVQAVATAEGGRVIVNDPEGGVTASLPDDLGDGPAGWGQSPERL